MIKIGLTGGIGSGKSMVSSLLEVLRIPVYVADTESKRLTNASPLIRERLIALLGESIYCGAEVDRKRLASCIFSDPECLKQVNAIIHPEVNRHFLAWVARQTSPVCAIETAILFESGFHRDVDVSVMVYAPLELRIERVVARDGLSREEVIRRINNQLADEVKKTYADYIIYNDDSRALIPQLNSLMARFR
ncbi:MAG: dephospho-CoA kinase [Tannerellaceae bacterium]|jgi:dephospho-CoA kinase|nr:dephospho-CoA kinase [Tannerellaceae bacterium]